MTAAYRFVIPVDGSLTSAACGPGRILGVACRSYTTDPAHHVDVWVQIDRTPTSSDEALGERTFVVVGTGQPWPEGATHVGLALTPSSIIQRPDLTVEVAERYGEFVWHVLEVTR